MNTQTTWHAGKPHKIADQVQISDEQTGRTVAVTYSSADAPIIAAAPELLAALVKLERGIRLWMTEGVTDADMTEARAAIHKATGGAQ